MDLPITNVYKIMIIPRMYNVSSGPHYEEKNT